MYNAVLSPFFHFFVGRFLPNQEYSPPDMPGQEISIETSASKCQNRCFNTDKCEYFTYGTEDRSCHIQNSSATLKESPGAISGPAIYSNMKDGSYE